MPLSFEHFKEGRMCPSDLNMSKKVNTMRKIEVSLKTFVSVKFCHDANAVRKFVQLGFKYHCANNLISQIMTGR